MMIIRVCRFALQITGVLLVISSIFEATVVSGRAHGHYEWYAMIEAAVLMLLCGIGFLLPQLWANLISALAMASAAVWLFYIDAFRWEHWWIDSLFFVPLLLTLWLGKRQGSSPFRRVPDGN